VWSSFSSTSADPVCIAYRCAQAGRVYVMAALVVRTPHRQRVILVGDDRADVVRPITDDARPAGRQHNVRSRCHDPRPIEAKLSSDV